LNNSLEFRDSKTSKFWFEKVNDAANFNEHSVEGIFDKLPISTLATLKRKVGNDFTAHIHFRTFADAIKGKTSEYCTIFYLGTAIHCHRNLLRLRDLDKRTALVKGDNNIVTTRGNHDYLYEAVFIMVINISENRQYRIPCPVRLQSLNVCDLNIGQAGNHSSNFPLSDISRCVTSELSYTIADGEINLLGENGILEKPELPEQMVKGRPQLVTEIPNKQRKVRSEFSRLLNHDYVLSCVSFSYNPLDDSVGVIFLEPLSQCLNGFEVLFSPKELEIWPIERMHRLYTRLKQFDSDYTTKNFNTSHQKPV
jgi:hypothetical protein